MTTKPHLPANLTESKHARESISSAPARESEQMDHFVRALSHDMSANFMVLEASLRKLKRNHGRNPLGELSENFAHVEACLRESKRFLDDLVLLAKTGSVDMQAEFVALGPLVREVIFEQRPLLDERGIEVTVAVHLPTVWCNEVRLRQIFTNLVRNAARHGCDAREPKIEIGQVAAPAKGDSRYVWLRVHDNGRGIAAAARDEIFLPGKRLAAAHPDGTGMGLAIVRKAIEHYGGTIGIDPSLDQGTAFLLSLPKSAEAVSPPSGEQVPPPAHQLHRPHHRRGSVR
ncbi:MAG: HAMP domain-containing histidine kinase [Pirellulales bacterium]|nr:HAMP domain-containing histidine kinase [Pirellulales bacterium]